MMCPRCNGSGEIARRNTGMMSYVCAGPVPEDARGVISAKCDRCDDGEVESDAVETCYED